MWFHVSENNVDIQCPLTELRTPGFEYADVDVTEPIFCVSPTVWQCVLSVSARKPTVLFVYRIDVANPLPATSNNSDIRDSDLTAEHRITQAVLEENGGSIGTKLVGKIQIDAEQIAWLKIVTNHKGVRPDHSQEMDIMWSVTNEDTWTLKQRGANLQTDWQKLVDTQAD